jgi:hypothetical protein
MRKIKSGRRSETLDIGINIDDIRNKVEFGIFTRYRKKRIGIFFIKTIAKYETDGRNGPKYYPRASGIPTIRHANLQPHTL